MACSLSPSLGWHLCLSTPSKFSTEQSSSHHTSCQWPVPFLLLWVGIFACPHLPSFPLNNLHLITQAANGLFPFSFFGLASLPVHTFQVFHSLCTLFIVHFVHVLLWPWLVRITRRVWRVPLHQKE